MDKVNDLIVTGIGILIGLIMLTGLAAGLVGLFGCGIMGADIPMCGN